MFYSTLTAALVQETRAREAAVGMIDQTCHSQFLLQPTPSKVCLFFHGFTATPGQFIPLGKAFFQAGHSVLIPLLPGHGQAGHWSGDRPPPLPEDPGPYQQFGLHWLRQAQALGQQVTVGGLSGGGTLAAWLALECPRQIEQALLFAPYLSNSNQVLDLFVRILDVYFEWRTKPGSVHFGYDGFQMPALEVFLNMGQEVLDQAEGLTVPLLIVSSEGDRAVSNRDHQALFKAVLPLQPKSWHYRFERALDVPHTMMTQAEGNKCQDLLIAIAKAFVESDLTWAEIRETVERIRRGKPFQAGVSELNLSQQSPDLAKMMATMINQP